MLQVPENEHRLLEHFEILLHGSRKRSLYNELFGLLRVSIENFETLCSGIVFDLPKNNFPI